MNASAISEGEKVTVLELLPQALNAAGVALALGQPRLADRAEAVLEALEADGRVYREARDIWRVKPGVVVRRFTTAPDPSEPHPDWCKNPSAHHRWSDCYG